MNFFHYMLVANNKGSGEKKEKGTKTCVISVIGMGFQTRYSANMEMSGKFVRALKSRHAFTTSEFIARGNELARTDE